MHAGDTLEIRIARDGRRLDAISLACLSDLKAEQEIHQDREAGDEGREMKHGGLLRLSSERPPSVTRHLQITNPAVTPGKTDRPLPVGKARSHPAFWIHRRTRNRKRQ